MLRLPDAWIWDFWLTDDGRSFHLYFLRAPRGDDPDARHWNVSLGHAVPADLTRWTVLADAIAPAPGPAFDDLTTWTGSVVRGPDDSWFMFYTGGGSREHGRKQRVGLATSADLQHWIKHPASPVLERDPRWYEQYPDAGWTDEAWRDPWVFPDPAGRGWHMLVTARSRLGAVDQRGVIGHASSPLGPFDVARAVRMTDESVYSGRLVRNRSGQWVMLAFRNEEPGRGFVGELTDPAPVGWAQDGTTLVVQPGGGRGLPGDAGVVFAHQQVRATVVTESYNHGQTGRTPGPFP